MPWHFSFSYRSKWYLNTTWSLIKKTFIYSMSKKISTFFSIICLKFNTKCHRYLKLYLQSWVKYFIWGSLWVFNYNQIGKNIHIFQCPEKCCCFFNVWHKLVKYFQEIYQRKIIIQFVIFIHHLLLIWKCNRRQSVFLRFHLLSFNWAII